MINHSNSCTVVSTKCNCRITPEADLLPMTQAEYFATLTSLDRGVVTPNLDMYRRMMLYDDNAVWRLGMGVIANLLDQALDILEP